jgi:hypothetical protein
MRGKVGTRRRAHDSTQVTPGPAAAQSAACEKKSLHEGGGASGEEKLSALGKTKLRPATPAGEGSDAQTLAPLKIEPVKRKTARRCV